MAREALKSFGIGAAGGAGKLLITVLGGWLVYKFFKVPAPTTQTEANLKAAAAAGRPSAELTKIAMSDPNVAAYSQQVANDPNKSTADKVAAVSSVVGSLLSSVKPAGGLGGLGGLGRMSERKAQRKTLKLARKLARRKRLPNDFGGPILPPRDVGVI